MNDNTYHNPKRRKRYVRGGGPCTHIAPCGRVCCCINAVPHQMHVCRIRTCRYCHPQHEAQHVR